MGKIKKEYDIYDYSPQYVELREGETIDVHRISVLDWTLGFWHSV